MLLIDVTSVVLGAEQTSCQILVGRSWNMFKYWGTVVSSVFGKPLKFTLDDQVSLIDVQTGIQAGHW